MAGGERMEGGSELSVRPVSPAEVLEVLHRGNETFRASSKNPADVSEVLVQRLAREGQLPYACVVCCSDSRVAPEHIFSAGLGDLFVVRVAGNVVGPTQLASCVYAAEHLDIPLILVLGHTLCGAVGAALQDGCDETLAPLVDPIRAAIEGERDPAAASVKNAHFAAAAIRADPSIARLVAQGSLQVCSALYHAETGEVDFF